MIELLLMLAQPAELPECDQERADSGNQGAMNQCAYRDYLIADAGLNAQWKVTSELMKQWDADARKYTDPDEPEPAYFSSLLKAQRAWLAYRDAQCESEVYAYTGGGGTIRPLLDSGCRTQLTLARTEELRQFEDLAR